MLCILARPTHIFTPEPRRIKVFVNSAISCHRKVIRRKLTQAPKLYYFDVGVANYLMHLYKLEPGTPKYGHAFEHLVMQEIIAYNFASNEVKTDNTHH
jgi:predicted AAA+ superfamily ATPase